MARSNASRGSPLSMSLIALGVLLFPAAIQAAAADLQPAPLVAARAVGHDALPLITAAPELRHLVKMAGRAVTAAGNTCGFADGNFNDYISCSYNNKCTVSMGGVGCCNTKSCGGFAATCYDYTAIGASCQTCTRTDAVYCSVKADGWCQTYHYPGSVIDFLCDIAPATINMLFSATTTYAAANHNQPIPSATGVVPGTSAAVTSAKATSAAATSAAATSAAATSAKVTSAAGTSAAGSSIALVSVTPTSVVATGGVVTITASPTVKTGASNPLLDSLLMWKLTAAVICGFMFLL